MCEVLGKTLVQTSAHEGSWARVKFLLCPGPGSDYATPELTGATELLSEDHFLKIADWQRASQVNWGMDSASEGQGRGESTE